MHRLRRASNACNNANDFAGENRGVLKGFTNGNVPVKGHAHQHNAFHGSEEVDKEHLGKAASKGYIFEAEPEDAQHLGMVAVDKPGQRVYYGQEVSTWAGGDYAQSGSQIGRQCSPGVQQDTHKEKGNPIQICMSSSPGMPNKKNEEGWNWVSLGMNIFLPQLFCPIVSATIFCCPYQKQLLVSSQ